MSPWKAMKEKDKEALPLWTIFCRHPRNNGCILFQNLTNLDRSRFVRSFWL